MKRISAIVIIGILCFSTLSVFLPQIKVNADASSLTDFESGLGNWQAISQMGGIVQTSTVYSHSGSHSLEQLAQSSGSQSDCTIAAIRQPIVSTSDQIELTTWVFVTGRYDAVSRSFFGFAFGDEPLGWNVVGWDVWGTEGSYLLKRPFFQSPVSYGLTLNVWHKVRIAAYLNTGTTSIWLDDTPIVVDEPSFTAGDHPTHYYIDGLANYNSICTVHHFIDDVSTSERTSAKILFSDDFESYTVGTFPSSGGWELVWNGMGDEYQTITDAVSYSPERALQLLGTLGWSANVQRAFSSSSSVLGYEAYIRCEGNVAEPDNVASICMWNIQGQAWGKRFAGVYFASDGYIYTEPIHLGSVFVRLMPYDPNVWYKVRVVIDRDVGEYSVLIDDVLKAENVAIQDTYEIGALMLAEGWAGYRVYFDDVTVFEARANAADPVGYWKFDEGSGTTAYDISGNGNTGELMGNPQWVNGIAGTSLQFDGIDDVVMVPSSSSLVVARVCNQLTLETWMKPTVALDSNSNPMYLMTKGNEYGFTLGYEGTPPVQNGKIRFCMGLVDPSTHYILPEEIWTTTDVWTAGTWYHLVATYDGEFMKIYVNGVLENSLSAPGTLWTQEPYYTEYPFSIGAYTWGMPYVGNLFFFNGVLDEVKIYNYARTAQEILNDYTSVPKGPVGYWKFDEGSGNIAYDSSGNGHDGTVYGASWTNGISNNALHFNGVSDYVEAPSSPSLSGFTQLTLEAWVKVDTLSMTKGYVVAKSDGWDHPNINDEYGLFIAGRTVTFHVANGGSSPQNGYLAWGTAADVINEANRWYHLAATWSGSTCAVYVDGTVVSSGNAFPGTSSIGSAPLTIGQIGHWPWTYFPGIIDEVKIYNYARTAEEIQADYAVGVKPKILTMFVDPNTDVDDVWSLPDGGTFTFRNWLQNKGYSVSTVPEAFPNGEITLSGLAQFKAVLAIGDFFEIPGNEAHVNTMKDYVNQGGGLILFGQHSHPAILVDEAFGLRWSGSAAGSGDPWSFYVDAAITDYSHPIMEGITALPKAGGVFIDWDCLIDESPLPSGTAVLARSTGGGGPYDPDNRIALIAFQYGIGKVVVGPWDGLVRPYGPTAVNGWSVVGEPIVKNKLLINTLSWLTAQAQPDFEISVSPDSQTAQPDSSVNYQITVTSKNGFSSSVSLDASFSPNPVHIGWTFDPAVVTPPPNGQVTSTLRINIYDDTPLETFTLTVTATSGMLVKNSEITLIVLRSLEVPYQNQGYAEWCSPTSLAMVLNYYGFTYHNWDYAKWKHLSTEKGVWVEDLETYLDDYYPTLTTKLGYYGMLEKEIILEDIRSNITEGYPVIMNLGPVPIWQGSGHAIVVVGFNETGLFINDPSGALFTEDGFLHLASTDPSYPRSWIHAYITWSDIAQFIRTWPLASILAVQGTSTPEEHSGSVHITDRLAIVFYHPGDPQNGQMTQDHYTLYLDKGLKWMLNSTKGQGWKLQQDNIISPDCRNLYVSANVSNNAPFVQSFTFKAEILGPNGWVYPITTVPRPIKDLQGYTEDQDGRASGGILDLTTILTKEVPYNLRIRLSDSGGKTVDEFTSEVFFWIEGTKGKMSENKKHLYLHFYDLQGNHVGLNYSTGLVDLEIAGSYYDDDRNGTIIIVVPRVLNVTIVVDATYAEDPVESYNLTVTLNTELDTFEQTYSGNIAIGEKQTFTTQASDDGLQLYAWQYIFKDNRRGTELRINVEDRNFQFIAPSKDFGVKYDPKMFVKYGIIIMCYGDAEMRLTATAVDSYFYYCTALAYDKQTRKTYVLIDKPYGPRCPRLYEYL